MKHIELKELLQSIITLGPSGPNYHNNLEKLATYLVQTRTQLRIMKNDMAEMNEEIQQLKEQVEQLQC